MTVLGVLQYSDPNLYMTVKVWKLDILHYPSVLQNSIRVDPGYRSPVNMPRYLHSQGCNMSKFLDALRILHSFVFWLMSIL